MGDGVSAGQGVSIRSDISVGSSPLLILFVLLHGYVMGGHSSIETVAVERTNILINTTVRDEQLLRRHFKLIFEDDLMMMMWMIVTSWQRVGVKFFRFVMDASSPRKAMGFEHVSVFLTMVMNLFDVPP